LLILLIHADKNKKKIRVNPPNPLNPRSIFNSDGFFAYVLDVGLYMLPIQ